MKFAAAQNALDAFSLSLSIPSNYFMALRLIPNVETQKAILIAFSIKYLRKIMRRLDRPWLKRLK